ncbi:NADH-quinone oxidoreductase subunit K [Aliidiomarina sanyensis]|uniref:Na+/H+ antiporter subunit C n=1 Tax=Aliidiomarina sanyensis TaxID=1249555 RepID=A0A432WGB6_9GAMM|nr:NADH-quinone oxidoreductase subunit K [Aliidiomarina sanyensis]RUO32850.1 Na+/H+ antiporter subunit C [Aliidiomarina sanyensis]
MGVDLWYALVGAVIIALSVFAFISARHLMKKLLAFNMMGSGVFLIMVGLPQHQHGVDAVPQALVLTGIVVAVSATALALVILRRYVRSGGDPAP